MIASRSDCSREPADDIPVVAEDAGEEASSPRLREVLFTCPNMPTHRSNLPAALRFREAFYTLRSRILHLFPHHRFRINEWPILPIHNNLCALVTLLNADAQSD